MNIEEIDAIVIEELKRSYMLEHIASERGCKIDGDLIKAISTVLEYFMVQEDYDDWLRVVHGDRTDWLGGKTQANMTEQTK